MSVLYTNLFTGPPPTVPTDFVLSEGASTGGTRDIQSNQFRLLTTATNFNNQRAILPSGNWNKADGEALFDTAVQAAGGQFFAVLRSTGDWQAGDDTASTTGYRILFDHSAGQILIFKDVSTVNTQLGATVTFTFNASTTYRNRFRMQGTTLTLTVWDTAGAEPGSPTATRTDSAIAGPGQFQLCFRTASTAVRDLRVDTLTLDDLVSGGRRPIFRRF